MNPRIEFPVSKTPHATIIFSQSNQTTLPLSQSLASLEKTNQNAPINRWRETSSSSKNWRQAVDKQVAQLPDDIGVNPTGGKYMSHFMECRNLQENFVCSGLGVSSHLTGVGNMPCFDYGIVIETQEVEYVMRFIVFMISILN
jgi:hypothetical protein